MRPLASYLEDNEGIEVDASLCTSSSRSLEAHIPRLAALDFQGALSVAVPDTGVVADIVSLSIGDVAKACFGYVYSFVHCIT